MNLNTLKIYHNSIFFPRKIYISIENFIDKMIILPVQASKYLLGDNSALKNCKGSGSMKIICIICRLFFHVDHECFADINDDFHRICINCNDILLNSL